MKKTFLYSAIIVCAVLISLEITCRIIEHWIPPHIVDIGLGFTPQSRLFVEDENRRGFMRTAPAKTIAFHTDSFTIKKDKRSCRIFALGGSSVNYLDSEFRLLEARLRIHLQGKFDDVDIINAGGHSYGSQRLVSITAEIMNYNPDLVLLYSGHNEFQEISQLKFASLKTIWVQELITKSALLRCLRDRITDVIVAKLRSDHNNLILKREIPDTLSAWRYNFTVKDVRIRMENYRDNLSRIIEICNKNKVPIIIGTVPSNLVNPYLPKGAEDQYKKVYELFDDHKYQEAATLGRLIIKNTPGRHQSSDSENKIIRSLAAKYGCQLADVENNIIAEEPHNVPGMALFKDHCHLNAKGNKVLINTYEPLILEILKKNQQ
jgi:lysophospholipase L1-like esterase